MNKKIKKILKIALLIIVLVIIIIVINTFRKMYIVNNLQSKIETYKSSNNYHILSVGKDAEYNSTTTINTYVKDDRKVMILENKTENDYKKMSLYKNNNKENTYIEAGSTKVAILDTEGNVFIDNINNLLETESKWELFEACLTAKINSCEHNGKKAYKIKNFYSSVMMYEEGKNELIIEKDTGLTLQTIIGNTTTEKTFEFNNVDDNIFIEPDINEYKIEDESSNTR